jgi:hypothetical protein
MPKAALWYDATPAQAWLAARGKVCGEKGLPSRDILFANRAWSEIRVWLTEENRRSFDCASRDKAARDSAQDDNLIDISSVEERHVYILLCDAEQAVVPGLAIAVEAHLIDSAVVQVPGVKP